MELKRYFAVRGADKFFRGHMVLAPFQLDNIVKYNKQSEIFTAIEYYYDKNTVAGSCLSFDIDFDGQLALAHETAKKISTQLDRLNIKHDCFFSGSKGFHIVVPTLIHGEKSYQLCKAIKRTSFNYEGVDEHIYKEKALFRVEGSINFKTSLYKTKIAIHSDIQTILNQSAIKQEIVTRVEMIPNPNLVTLINKAIPLYKELIAYRPQSNTTTNFDVPICIKRMWEDKDPPRDRWHITIYTLVKAMYSAGLTQDEITDNFDSHDFWSSICTDGYNRRSYTKIISSLAKSNKLAVGCKNGLGAEAMKHYCSDLCPFILDSGNIWSLYVKDNSNTAVRSI